MNPGTSIDRVYLLGAGASVPYGFPAMANLSWEIVESLIPTHRTILRNAIRECFGKDLGPDDGTNFEDLLNLLNPAALLYLADTDIIAADSSRHQASDVALAGLREFIQNKCVAVANTTGPFDTLVNALRVGGSYTLPPLTDPTVQISRSGFVKTDSPSRHPGTSDSGSG